MSRRDSKNDDESLPLVVSALSILDPLLRAALFHLNKAERRAVSASRFPFPFDALARSLRASWFAGPRDNVSIVFCNDRE